MAAYRLRRQHLAILKTVLIQGLCMRGIKTLDNRKCRYARGEILFVIDKKCSHKPFFSLRMKLSAKHIMDTEQSVQMMSQENAFQSGVIGIRLVLYILIMMQSILEDN